MKTRIVKRITVDKRVRYVIQQKHFLFRLWWVDAAVNSIDFAGTRDSFDTHEEAKKNLCYFDGSKHIDKILS